MAVSLETLFTLVNAVAFGGWLLLLLAPRWRYSATLLAPVVVPGLFALVYVALMIGYWPQAPGGGFGSIAEVQTLFDVPGLLVAGWLHYLSFDLFIGSWQVRDAQRCGIRHGLVLPCLLLTFVLGPVGLGCYLALRTFHQRVASL